MTGASRGIGRATAHAMAAAAAGAFAIVHYGKSQSDADLLVAEIRSRGSKADAVGFDLAAPEGAPELATKERALAGDRLEIIVANAGISKAGGIEDHTIADFDILSATNVRAPFIQVQQLLPLLREGSSVIVVTSLGARVSPPFPGQMSAPSIPVYAATEGALETPLKHWASLLGPRGIRVKCRRTGRDRDRYVEFDKDEGGPQSCSQYAVAQANRETRRCR
jgi:3-oxoacyl-[acyl-carrier protein] reductase